MESFDIKREVHKDEALSELGFDMLEAGDRVTLHTEIGHVYELEVAEISQEGKVYAKLKIGKRDQLSREIENWDERPDLVELMGSCQELEINYGGAILVLGEKPRELLVGERTWLGFNNVENEPKPLITPIVKNIVYTAGTEQQGQT